MMVNDRQITISVGASRRATSWKPQTLYLSELYERLRLPTKSTEVMESYLKLSKSQQDDLKDVGGFVGGALSGLRRKASGGRRARYLTLEPGQYPSRRRPGCRWACGLSGLRLLYLLYPQAPARCAPLASAVAAGQDLHR